MKPRFAPFHKQRFHKHTATSNRRLHDPSQSESESEELESEDEGEERVGVAKTTARVLQKRQAKAKTSGGAGFLQVTGRGGKGGRMLEEESDSD